MTSEILTASQLDALLDILIHHETYAEVQSFQSPESIETYGWPFVSCDDSARPIEPHRPSSSPLLQLVLTRILLPAPAVRELSTDFWPVTFKGLMKKFGDADLSDSYDKGTLGTRKRLATASSVVHEAVTRGLLSGASYVASPDLHCPYDREKAEDLARAWRDCISQIVYGDLIDEIFDQLAKTDDLEAHSPALKGAVEYAQLHIAAFLHQVFIVSAEGPYLLKIIENVHKLVPYTVISQTLRVGNAATMINAMSRLFLSKVSLGAISNWIGLTSSSSDGMNLMQRIFSLVLEWDATDFRKTAEKICLDQGDLSKEHMSAIDKHLASDQNQSELVRQKSIREQISIIVAIFRTENPELVASLTDRQHTLCLEYYAAKLAIRDREQITGVLCNSVPDLTTAIVSEGVRVLDPMIRVVHKNVDLREHLAALESFLTDFIKTTKPKKRDSGSRLAAPSIKDFVHLLQRNRHLLWVYLHQFSRRCPDLRNTWQGWMNDTIKVFRRRVQVDTPDKTASSPLPEDPQVTNASDIEDRLQDAFQLLSYTQRGIVLEQINAHSQYLVSLEELSRTKTQMIIDNVHGKRHSVTSMPGIYASQWESLLNNTLITPSLPGGPLRHGSDVKDFRATRKVDKKGKPVGSIAVKLKQHGNPDDNQAPPVVTAVVDALGPQFKMMVADIARDGLPK